MAHDIFISYSSKDKEIADAVCAHMEARGMKCWYAPRDITPGADWAESIISGINGARLMILIFTDYSNSSEQVLREVAYAADKGLVIVPFRLSGIKPAEKLGVYLRPTHWLDAMNKELATSIQLLGNRCEANLEKIDREQKKIAKSEGRSRGSRTVRTALIVAVAVAAVILAIVLINNARAEKFMDPADSQLIASVDPPTNGIIKVTLVDRLECRTGLMTCDEYTDAFIADLNELAHSSSYNAVRSENGMAMEIYKGSDKTPFSLVFLSGENMMITGDHSFSLVGLVGEKESTQAERLRAGAAAIKAAFPEISTADAKELALVLYGDGIPVHARTGQYELYCQVSDQYSFTILDNVSYID